jgi:hypothetical protein
MLLKEFLKEHRKFAEQQSTIGELKTTVAQQQKINCRSTSDGLHNNRSGLKRSPLPCGE